MEVSGWGWKCIHGAYWLRVDSHRSEHTHKHFLGIWVTLKRGNCLRGAPTQSRAPSTSNTAARVAPCCGSLHGDALDHSTQRPPSHTHTHTHTHTPQTSCWPCALSESHFFLLELFLISEKKEQSLRQTHAPDVFLLSSYFLLFFYYKPHHLSVSFYVSRCRCVWGAFSPLYHPLLICRILREVL